MWRLCVPTRTCPRDTMSKTTAGLSHTVTQYSQGKAFESGIVSSTTTPLCCAAPEEANFLQLQLNRGLSLPVLQQGPVQAAGETSKAAQWSLWVSITWNIKQHIRGRLTCLFDFGGQKYFKGRKKSINVKRVRKGLFIPEDLGEKLDHLSPERLISIIIHRPGSPILCSTMLLNNNQQEKCLQFSRWKGVQRIRFTYFEVKEDFLAQKDKHSFVRYKLVLLHFSCNLPFYYVLCSANTEG